MSYSYCTKSSLIKIIEYTLIYTYDLQLLRMTILVTYSSVCFISPLDLSVVIETRIGLDGDREYFIHYVDRKWFEDLIFLKILRFVVKEKYNPVGFWHLIFSEPYTSVHVIIRKNLHSYQGHHFNFVVIILYYAENL